MDMKKKKIKNKTSFLFSSQKTLNKRTVSRFACRTKTICDDSSLDQSIPVL